MCDPVSAVMAVATVASTAMSYSQGQKQQKQAKAAAAQAQKNSDAQLQAAERDMNARNAKRPDTAAMASANQQAAQAGIGSTSLTGPQGVDPNSLVLGRQTLLGA